MKLYIYMYHRFVENINILSKSKRILIYTGKHFEFVLF